jgi:formiminotetrahydrofolate cyclodeaminase
MKLTEKRVYDLLAAFRSSDPTPGGGSASALAGAIGASLLAMVAGLPKPRATSEEETTDLRNAGLRCTELATALEQLVNRDSDAYNLVMEAYRLPKVSDDEKTQRAAVIQDALKEATETPLGVMRRCSEALGLVPVVERLGNPNAASDVKVAVYLLRAGVAGAAENVEINLGSLKDEAYVQRVREQAAALEKATSDYRLTTSD